MKIKWLYLIFAVLITPLAARAQEAKKSVYPGDFMPPGIRIDKPVHYYKINRNPDQPSYGYSFNPTFPDACSEMCYEPGTKISFSGYKDIRMPDGRKLRSGIVKVVVTPDGKRQDVTDQNITVPVGVVATEGIFFWSKDKEFTPSLPAGSFHANYNGNVIDWVTPIDEKTSGVCIDCEEKKEGPLNTLKSLFGGIVDRLTPDSSNEEDEGTGINPPARFDEYFTYHAKKDSQDFEESMNNYNEYKKYIMASAKAFNLPPDMLFCLKHRESRETQAYSRSPDGQMEVPEHRRDKDGNRVKSRSGKLLPRVRTVDWFPRAVSSTGAIGLGQLLPGTAFDLVTRIPESKRSYRTSYQKYLQLVQKRHPRVYRINDPQDYRKSITGPTEDRAADVRYRYLRQHKRNGTPSPVSFSGKSISDSNALETCDHRCDPAISIGLSAMYLRYLLDNYGSKRENAKMDLQYKVFITGAYNQGPGSIMKLIDSNTSPAKWRENLVKARGREVRGHMESTEKCMRTLKGELPIIPPPPPKPKPKPAGATK